MLFNFEKAFVRPGTKVSDESRPTLSLTPTFNTFRLNKLGRATVMTGSNGGNGRVILFDMAAQYPDIAEDQRFYICEGYTNDKGEEVGAKVAEDTGNFSYSGVYGAILANKNNIINITPNALVDMDLVYPKDLESETSGQHTSKYAVSTVLVPYANGEVQEIFSGVFRQMFVLTNAERTPHTRREVTKKTTSDPVGEAADLFSDDDNN